MKQQEKRSKIWKKPAIIKLDVSQTKLDTGDFEDGSGRTNNPPVS